MRQTIRVEQLLRESVQTPYRDLVTRSTGRAVRSSIQQVLAAGTPIVAMLDFSDVGLVDFSCADEIIAKLLQDGSGSTFLVLEGLREEQLEAIEHVLSHHDLAALVHDRDSGACRPVGRLSADHHTAFANLQDLGPATAPALAERIGWNGDRSTEVLLALARLRLVQVEQDSYRVPLA